MIKSTFKFLFPIPFNGNEIWVFPFPSQTIGWFLVFLIPAANTGSRISFLVFLFPSKNAKSDTRSCLPQPLSQTDYHSQTTTARLSQPNCHSQTVTATLTQPDFHSQTEPHSLHLAIAPDPAGQLADVK